MDDKLKTILETTRKLSLKGDIRNNIPMDKLCEKLNITKEEFYSYFKKKSELVEKALEFERDTFKVIFDKYNFEGVNAIDILMTVSGEMASSFKNLSPAFTFNLRKHFPKVYREHIQKRIEFIFGKIQINLQKGISQGIYREDLSVELIARLYIARLIDIHNPELFPPEKFSFALLFNVMIDSFIRSISNLTGLQYYEEKKKSIVFAFDNN